MGSGEDLEWKIFAVSIILLSIVILILHFSRLYIEGAILIA